jgi:hypothetical protein
VADVSGPSQPNAGRAPLEPLDGREEMRDRMARRGRIDLGGEEPSVFEDDDEVNAIDAAPPGDQLTVEEITEVSAQIAAAKRTNPDVEGN